MERIKYRITLDTHRTGIQRTLQGFETADGMARSIAINLVSGGDTYEIPLANVTAMMYVMTPNSEEPSINSCKIEGNTIIYDVLPITEEGITEMQIKLIETSLEGARKVLVSPRFAVEVTEGITDDDNAEQNTTFTALENAISLAQSVYNVRLVSVDIDEACVFRAFYADGTVYENSNLNAALFNGNAKLSESFAVGGTNTRKGEDIDNSKYYSSVSMSSAIEARDSVETVRALAEEAKKHTSYTVFAIDLENGDLVYDSPNYEFNINKSTGTLEFKAVT